MERVVRVGTGVMLKRGNKILLGKRHLDKIEEDLPVLENMLVETWTMPGGKLELNEKLFDCAKRETFEETGIKVLDAKLFSIGDASLNTGHYMTVGFVSENFEGEAYDKEPHKISGWDWFDLDSLPSPLFGLTKLMIENYKSGIIYSEK